MKQAEWQDSHKLIELVDRLKKESKWIHCVIGNKWANSTIAYYVVLVDFKVILIDEDFSLNLKLLGKIEEKSKYLRTWNLSDNVEFFLTSEEYTTLLDYQYKLRKIEELFLSSIEDIKKDLLLVSEVQIILENFFRKFYQDKFKDIKGIHVSEDILLADMFSRNIRYENYYYSPIIENNVRKLLDIFNAKYLNVILDIYSFSILVSRLLFYIANKLYTNEFSTHYSGYFKDVKNSKIDDCIASYYDIDFIEHKQVDSIGMFTYYLKNNNISAKDYTLYDLYFHIRNKIESFEKNRELDFFEKELLIDTSGSPLTTIDTFTIEEVDLMSGIEFEDFICELFKRMGYSASKTPGSGDQGIDIIAAKNGMRLGIQTKCYSNTVSNKAVQEVASGIRHYNLSKAVVITNNYFTKSAIELALSNNVILWDREILKEKIKEVS